MLTEFANLFKLLLKQSFFTRVKVELGLSLISIVFYFIFITVDYRVMAGAMRRMIKSLLVSVFDFLIILTNNWHLIWSWNRFLNNHVYLFRVS